MATKTKDMLGPSRLLRIGVQGFKSINELQLLHLAPVTVLSGANSAGKSSMMQPLLLLKQTLEASFDPGTLLLSDQNAKFTTADQMLFRCTGENCSRDFSIELEDNQGMWIRLTYSCPNGEGVHISKLEYREGLKPPINHITPEMESEKIEALLPNFLKKIVKDVSGKEKVPLKWKVRRERFYLGFTLDDKDKDAIFMIGGNKVLSPASVFLRHISGIFHLPGLRGNPERGYPTTSVESVYPGTFDKYVASVINQWQRNKDVRIKEIGDDLKTLGLTWKVDARKINDTQVELRVGRLPNSRKGGANDLVNIADVGFGVSQTLPVVVALRAATPGRIIYLEQPEIHLHPNAQSALARIIAKAAKRGVIVVLETHSSILLRSIQTLVALGELEPNEVSLNWFKRDELTGATRVSQAVPDRYGAYGDWPEDFDDIALRVERDYLDAIEARQNHEQ